MLQKEAVVPEMISLIKELQSNSLFKDHILTGGTALALHLGHRTSTDIDLFTLKEQSAIAFVHFLRSNYKNVTIEIAKDDFTRAIINGIKVELVQYNEKYIEEPLNEDGICLLHKNDIAAMKLDAMFKRSEARDFIDIAYLLKEMPLNQMFDLYEKKMGKISRVYMKRTLLTKSHAIKDNEWLKGGIIMLRHDIIPTDIPKFIEEKIKENNQIITDKIAASNIKKKINKVYTRNIIIKISTNIDSFIKSTEKYNKNPLEITKLLFSHIANDKRLFENIITSNNPRKQKEYAKGSFEVLSEACEKTISFIKDENNTKDYINWFSSMQNLYSQMEDTFKYFPPGDFNDGLYVTSGGLAKSFEKAMKLINEGNRSDNR